MTILCYHAVEPGWISPLAITPPDFAAHCAWLARHREVIALSDALTLLDRGGRLPRGVVALTFDDGFASVFEHALPVLKRHRLPASIFVVAETLTPSGRAVDWVDTPPSYVLKTLNLEQLLELRDAGFGIGSHSYSHRDLTTLDDQECVHDLTASREVLEDLLHRPVPYLAYPRGRHNEMVRHAAQQAGYSHSLSLPESRERHEAHAVPRVGIHQGNGLSTIRLKTHPWYLPLRTSRIYRRSLAFFGQ